MTEFYHKNWMKLWNSAGYREHKINNFNNLDAYLSTPPAKILDIGCGMAWESQQFNKKYNTELWLLDGDESNNENKPLKSNEGKWHPTADTMLFYHPMDVLDQKLQENNVTNYHLVDVNNVNIPSDVKFDVITSWLSCGFHYPVSTYRDLILRHSHPNTVIVMDLRVLKPKTNKLAIVDAGVEIVEIIGRGRKHVNAHIRFV
jgi:SAM-dependent methyltransferase